MQSPVRYCFHHLLTTTNKVNIPIICQNDEPFVISKLNKHHGSYAQFFMMQYFDYWRISWLKLSWVCSACSVQQLLHKVCIFHMFNSIGTFNWLIYPTWDYSRAPYIFSLLFYIRIKLYLCYIYVTYDKKAWQMHIFDEINYKSILLVMSVTAIS